MHAGVCRGWPAFGMTTAPHGSSPLLRHAALLGFQNPQHREYCVPTARCRRRPKEPVDLAEIANCFHAAAVHPIHETVLRANDSHKPLPTFGKSNRKRNSAASSLRQDAYKLNNICARWLSSKRIVHFQSNQITALAESDGCFKRQLPAQLGKELCAQPRFANDKRACGAHVHGIVDAQFFGEHARTKSPVSSYVDTPEENDQSHAAHCCNTEASRSSGSGWGAVRSLTDRCHPLLFQTEETADGTRVSTPSTRVGRFI